MPKRLRPTHPKPAAVWAKNSKDVIAVTCSTCLRTSPVAKAARALNARAWQSTVLVRIIKERSILSVARGSQ